MKYSSNSSVLLLGVLNSKHIAWRCNTTTYQSLQLQSFAVHTSLKILAPNEPKYYSYNSNVIPDILDILIIKKYFSLEE